jgi:dTDP-4-amino-4,6-dideoxygalactose transaminase
VLQQRKKTASVYTKLLQQLGIEPPLVPAYAEHGFLRYPLLVKQRAAFFEKAIASHIELGDWFLSPLHPVQERLEAWNYQWGENPIADKISRHMVNLPTHPGIDEQYGERIGRFIKENRDAVFDTVDACLKTGAQ